MRDICVTCKERKLAYQVHMRKFVELPLVDLVRQLPPTSALEPGTNFHIDLLPKYGYNDLKRKYFPYGKSN